MAGAGKSGTVLIGSGAASSGAGGAMSMTVGTGTTTGGALTLSAGTGVTGGPVSMSAGSGTTSTGGAVSIAAGAGSTGGAFSVVAGEGSGSTGGAIIVTAGLAVSALIVDRMLPELAVPPPPEPVPEPTVADIADAALGGDVPAEIVTWTMANGLRIIVWPDHDIPNVAMYNVVIAANLKVVRSH